MGNKKNTPKKSSKNEEFKDSSKADIKFPENFEKNHKAKYDKMKDAEMPFNKFLEIEKHHYKNQELLKQNKAAKYKPALSPDMTACGNGDFEEKIDTNQWQGAYGDVRNIPGSFIEGFIGGPINSTNSHQTWVATAPDPNVPISTTAPSSTGAVRIGNNINGYGSELISKTFIVDSSKSVISFWYAAVMQNPIGHPPSEQPLFWVRVTDVSGAIVPGAFDFGNGSDKLIADINNPFFKSKGQVVYKDWSCAQIDLSSQIGNQVTIEFISGDCGYGGHWGYSYIDRYCDTCEGSPTGTLNYDCDSNNCGIGELCFDYTLPFTQDNNGNTVTGTLDLKLDIYQNGTLITSIISPTLTSGTRYCFQINPSTISGLNLGLAGFDFVLTGKFAISSFALGTKKIGLAPYGISPDENDDYKIECKSCKDYKDEQEAYLLKKCSGKVNKLDSYNCKCPDNKKKSDCGCSKNPNDGKDRCKKAKQPKLEPCVNITWGDSNCDCFETTDFEVACITVCNNYENVIFEDFTINKIIITDENGKPVDILPNGKPAIEIVPSGAICFGDIPPCIDGKASCVSRELAISTTGARKGKYRIKLLGVCYKVRFSYQKELCFDLKLCGD